jgi:hypothetical protein
MQDEVTIWLIIVPLKGWKSSNIWEESWRTKILFRRNEEQIEVKECLLSFGAEFLVFQFAVQKFKD